MKLSMSRATLEAALFRVQGIADKRSTMPVLSHVMLGAKEEGLSVSATDTEVGLAAVYPAQIDEVGVLAAPARGLYDIVRSLSSEEVRLESGAEQRLSITGGSAQFELVGIGPEQFPPLPKFDLSRACRIPAQVLLGLIDRTLFCVSTDENRLNLGGIYCEPLDSGRLRLVATDGHRLAMAETALDLREALPEGVVVPRKAFAELKRIVTGIEGAETLALSFSNHTASLGIGALSLSVRLVEGRFPDYRQVIPTTGLTTVKLPVKRFADGLRRVALLSDGRSGGIKLTFSESELVLLAEDPHLGSAKERLDISYDGKPVTIGFNARYILDALHWIDGDTVAFDIADDLSPGILRPVSGNDYLAVVMPMRV